MSDIMLKAENLAKRFGGIVATDDLSLDVARANCMPSSARTAPARPR